MKVKGNVAIHFGEVLSPQEKEELKENKKEKRQNVFAGEMKNQTDPIAKKRAEAQKKAMAVVKEAYHNDLKIDHDIEENCNKADELRKSIAQTRKDIADIDEMTKQAEQMEEGEAKEEMLTNLKEFRDDYVDMLVDDERKKAKAIGIVSAIKLERPKMDQVGAGGMGDAKNQAKEILEAAGDEIMGMLVEEGKDFMDEAEKEQEEKAEKLAEKQEEMEEFIEDAKEKRKEREEMVELTENAVTMEQIQQEVKTEIANIVDKMKLVAEDVKGVTVDKQI